ncbi:MAG: hypothetical protein WCW35_04980 [Bacteroidota bacterium]|jgi:hypothetical protein
MTEQTFFTNTHHLNESGIALYVDSVLLDRADDLPTEILDHVEQCTECAAQVLEMCEIMQEVRIDRTMKHPTLDASAKEPQRLFTFYRVAALFLFGIFGGTLYYYLSSYEKNGMPETARYSLPADTLAEEIEKPSPKTTSDQYAMNFTPSPNLDDLVQSEFRSEAITVISPEIGAIVAPPITFRWKSYGAPVKIKVLSNKEVTVLTSIVNANSFVTAKPFAPGLYYWKLEANDDLLFVGKFFVK